MCNVYENINKSAHLAVITFLKVYLFFYTCFTAYCNTFYSPAVTKQSF